MRKLLNEQRYAIYNKDAGFLCGNGIWSYFSFTNFWRLNYKDTKEEALKEKIKSKLWLEKGASSDNHREFRELCKEKLSLLKDSHVILVDISIEGII